MGDLLQIMVDSVAMTTGPDDEAEANNELLFGECVEVTEELDEGWIKGICKTDNYEGYLPVQCLLPQSFEATHTVKALRSFIFSEPGFKSAPLGSLSFFAHIAVTENAQDGFVLIEHGGWMFANHLIDINDTLPDIVDTALKFEGAPYLWGGRTSLGLDCSALVQLSLMAAGIACPRDSKDQAKIGKAVKEKEITRGDLVFFDGHVGIMVDDTNILNATARSMDTRIEKLSDVADHYKGIKKIRRTQA